MIGWSDASIWTIIIVLGIGTFLIRYSFLGLLGGRDLPEWVLRHLRYTVVAILPALVLPMILAPSAATGSPEPARMAAAAVALVVGYLTRHGIATVLAGVATFGALQWLL